MDEFTSIGKVGVLSKGISYIAGYNLRMLPIIQSPNQLVEVYGQDVAQTFTTNHALNIIFPPKASETQTAKDISEWLGNQTVKSVSKSRSNNMFKTDGNTNSTSEQSRALMLPQEITSLGEGKELVIMENIRPILAEKVVYFKDPEFIRRLKSVSKSLRALGGKAPTRKQMDHAIRQGELAAKVPLLNLEEHNRLNADEEMITVTTPKGSPTLKAQELVDFSSVKKPPPGEMDEAALKAYADDLCRAMGMVV
jgi:type IV secretion system protein VirD4